MLVWVIAFQIVTCFAIPNVTEMDFDVVVYGATPSGIAAAIAVANQSAHLVLGTSFHSQELRIALLEPTPYIGGMCSPGGIGLRDSPSPNLMQGIPRQWAMYNAQHYNRSDPQWQPDNYVGNQSFWKMLNQFPSIKVYTNTPLMGGGVPSEPGKVIKKNGATIIALATTSFKTNDHSLKDQITWWNAKYFIDASYEGDLMMASGANFTIGRDPSDMYNEPLNGIRPLTSYGNFKYEVNAKWEDGSLLKFIDPEPLGKVGSGDSKVMSYSFRPCITTKTENKAPFLKPANYEGRDFELLRRYMYALSNNSEAPAFTDIFGVYGYHSFLPKHDLCDSQQFPFTSDAPGVYAGYVQGDWKQRNLVIARQRYYLQGMLWFLVSDPSVPAKTKDSTLKWGLCKDEWPNNGHYPLQLYVREGPRMIGEHVTTHQDLQPDAWGNRNDSIGLGTWNIDIHVIQRVAIPSKDGKSHVVSNEGNMMTAQKNPFELSYSILLPKHAEVSNLLVPVCNSVTHVAWGAIREEPTLMQLGIATGTAVAIASHLKIDALQNVPISRLQEMLIDQGTFIHQNSPLRNKLTVSQCKNENIAQKWLLKGEKSVQIVLASWSSMCLAIDPVHAPDGGHGQAIVLLPCTSSLTQWELLNNASAWIRAQTSLPCLHYSGQCQCVNVVHVNANLELWNCESGGAGQTTEAWIYNVTSQQLITKGTASSRCITAPSS